MKLDMICPVIERDREFLETLLASRRKFWRGEGDFCLLVGGELPAPWLDAIVREHPDVKVIAQRDLVGDVPFGHVEFWDESTKRVNIQPTPGWHIQQIVKLAASKLVTTEVYGAIDADCFFTHPFDPEVFLRDGIPWSMADYRPKIRGFYEGSAKLLGFPPEVIPARRLLWRPPFFFSRALASNILDRVAEVAQCPWVEALCRASPHWGEVPLYHVGAHVTGQWHSLHREVESFTHEPVQWPHNNPSVEFASWDVDQTFSGRYQFGVVHANRDYVQAADVSEAIKNRLA